MHPGALPIVLVGGDDVLGGEHASLRAKLAITRRVLGGRRAPRRACGPVHVVAHAFGALHAVAWAQAHPEAAASLTLVDPVPPDPAGLHAWSLRASRSPRLAHGPVPFDLRPAMALLTLPTLVISCGRPFGDLGTRMFDALLRAPRQLCTLPGSGHFPWVDASARFFRTVEDFLAEVESAQGFATPRRTRSFA